MEILDGSNNHAISYGALSGVSNVFPSSQILSGSEQTGSTPSAAFVNTYSVLFGGTDEYATAGDVLDFDYNVPFSLSCWFKTSYTSAAQCLISKQSNTAPSRGYALLITAGGDVWFYLVNTAGSNELRTVRTGTEYRDGSWHHIVATYDGGADWTDVTMIIDGTSVSLGLGDNTLSATTVSSTSLMIGSRGAANWWLNGNLDEPSIWDKELSVSEAQELYNNGNPMNPLNHSAAANLVGWWRMGDDDTFPNLTDNSTNSNTMVMTNMESGDIEEDVPSA